MLEKAIKLANILKEKGYTLTSVESLTGGMFSQTMTSICGASSFFKGALVTYMSEEKARILGISYDDIDRYGVVSQEVAMQMCSHGQQLMASDFCISFTGNAGPSAMEDKPVGLVYIGISCFSCTKVGRYQFHGNREEIRKQCVETGLDILIEQITKNY